MSFSISVLQERVHGVMKVFFQVDLLYRNRNSHRKCSVTFLKKRLWYRCFPMKFLGRPFFIEHSVVASVFLYSSYHFLFIIFFPVSIINTPSSSKLIFWKDFFKSMHQFFFFLIFLTDKKPFSSDLSDNTISYSLSDKWYRKTNQIDHTRLIWQCSIGFPFNKILAFKMRNTSIIQH